MKYLMISGIAMAACAAGLYFHPDGYLAIVFLAPLFLAAFLGGYITGSALLKLPRHEAVGDDAELKRLARLPDSGPVQ